MELTTVQEAKNFFVDKETAKKYIANLRWGEWAKCPVCGNEKVYIIDGSLGYKCANKKCYKKFSVLKSTLFEGSNISYENILIGIFAYCKSRGRILSHEMCDAMDIAAKNEFFVTEKIKFAFDKVERVGKTTHQIFDETLCNAWRYYLQYEEIKEAPNFNKPFHVSGIDDISDPKQYTVLLRYTKYYINVYCRFFIFIDFASAEEVLSETFLYMSENGIKEYNTDIILKLIWKTVNKMWTKFLNAHPKYNGKLAAKNKRNKENERLSLKRGYIINLLKQQKEYKGFTTKELVEIPGLIEEKKQQIIAKRKKQKLNYDFHSHFE